MCLFNSTPRAADPVLPPEYAAQKAPDGAAVKTAVGRRATDKVKSGSPTILTSGSGVTMTAPTERKTLLGQ